MKKRILTNVEPKNVFKYFEDFTRIPRESGNEKEMASYLSYFAAEHGLSYYCDSVQNVIIKKDASPGYENHPGVILQCHMDMVCEKNANVEHDFSKDPINPVLSDDRISAAGTTLGADNGIGLAIALAILADSKARHPSLELLCTSDEECGMTGAENFDISLLSGRFLINLDANDEGVLVVGCAGGPGVQIEIPCSRTGAESGLALIQVDIKGLKGGHSGEDIHRGRANAIKLMGRLLMAIGRTADMHICSISGGLKYNAIPREASAQILVPADRVADIRKAVLAMNDIFIDEYLPAENGINVSIAIMDETRSPADGLVHFDRKTTAAILDFICLSQNGILRMDKEFKDLVESSVSLGVMRTELDRVIFQSLTRSSVESIYMDIYYGIQRLAKCVGGSTSIISNCPEWPYDPASKLRQVFQDAYREMYGKEPDIRILHAGLECGVFCKKADGRLDMIAAGPDIRDLHTPGEYVVISSVQRFWQYFRNVLASMLPSPEQANDQLQ